MTGSGARLTLPASRLVRVYATTCLLPAQLLRRSEQVTFYFGGGIRIDNALLRQAACLLPCRQAKYCIKVLDTTDALVRHLFLTLLRLADHDVPHTAVNLMSPNIYSQPVHCCGLAVSVVGSDPSVRMKNVRKAQAVVRTKICASLEAKVTLYAGRARVLTGVVVRAAGDLYYLHFNDTIGNEISAVKRG